MKKKLSAKLNSYLALQNHLIASKTLVAAVPALQEAIDDLVDFILEINLNAKIQASPSGAAEAKRDALDALGDVAYEVAGGILAFADKSGNPTLAARVRFSRSAVSAGSSNAVVARVQDFIDVATENLDSLGDHGVTADKLKTLKQALKAFDAVRTLPRNAIGAGAAATKALERLFPQVDRLLENQIDRLVWQFRASTPDFYDKYQTARSIVSGATAGANEETPAAPLVNPVTKAA